MLRVGVGIRVCVFFSGCDGCGWFVMRYGGVYGIVCWFVCLFWYFDWRGCWIDFCDLC